MVTTLVLLCLFVLVLIKDVCLLDNGLARTPPMGWMSWGYYMCADECDKNPDKCLDENLIMSVADAFYSEGYLEAGYEYIIIDDCWSERKREYDGTLKPDKIRFPRGMKFLADYIHARGLKFGMYTNIAKDTCMRYPGSRDHFEVDVKSFAEWEVDYLKVDGCFVEEEYLDRAYVKLGYHLNQTGRPMVYSCSWPYYKKYIHKHVFDFNKVVSTCNLWRDFHDTAVNWGNVRWIIEYFEEQATNFQKTHGPGHWHDPDMLIVGTNHLTPGQNRIHMAVWAMLAAPLIISCDMSKVSDYEKSLLLNLDLIAIAQDPKGVMATPHKLNKHVTLWVKPHSPLLGDKYPSYSFALVNLGRMKHFVSFSPSKYAPDFTYDDYRIMDVFARELITNVTNKDTIEVTVPAEDVLMYAFYPV